MLIVMKVLFLGLVCIIYSTNPASSVPIFMYLGAALFNLAVWEGLVTKVKDLVNRSNIELEDSLTLDFLCKDNEYGQVITALFGFINVLFIFFEMHLPVLSILVGISTLHTVLQFRTVGSLYNKRFS